MERGEIGILPHVGGVVEAGLDRLPQARERVVGLASKRLTTGRPVQIVGGELRRSAAGAGAGGRRDEQPRAAGEVLAPVGLRGLDAPWVPTEPSMPFRRARACTLRDGLIGIQGQRPGRDLPLPSFAQALGVSS